MKLFPRWAVPAAVLVALVPGGLVGCGPPEKDEQAWAQAEAERGDALYRQARGVRGEEGRRLVSEAAAAYRSALAAFDPVRQEAVWAQTQDNLGTALGRLADGTPGAAEEASLRNQAAAAYRQAIEVYSRTNALEPRARAQSRLGWLLYLQSFDAGTEEGARQLGEAAAALRGALEVLAAGQEETRDLWAETQVNLGVVLEAQATRSHGAETERLLAEAVAAYREAARVYTRDRVPEAWARLQLSLGVARTRQAAASGGEEARQHFAEAKAALRGAAEVITRDRQPENWALCRNNLGHALTREALLVGGEASARLLEEAVAASRESLEVWTRERYPQDWAFGQITLGNALLAQGRQSGGSGEQVRLLDEAEAALRGALEVYGRESSPQNWAMARNDLGVLLLFRAGSGPAADRAALEEALAAFRDALAVRTREDLPGRYLESRGNEARALEALGRHKEAAAIAAELSA